MKLIFILLTGREWKKINVNVFKATNDKHSQWS